MIKPLLTVQYDEMLIDGTCINALNQQGYNRSHSGLKRIQSETDSETILTFLNEYRDSPKTKQLYAKEIKRLCLWCIHKGNVGFTELSREHFMDYQAFLACPQPELTWCGNKTARTNKDGSINTNWRPFASKLSPASIKKALKILNSFFSYLVDVHYLQANPIAMQQRRKKASVPENRLVERYLELDELHIILDALDQYPQRTASHKFRVFRARYIIRLLFYSGLRISEASQHTMGHFIQRHGCWFLSVIGKGKKPRDIPVPDELLQVLADFRSEMGLTREPVFKESTPLIPDKNGKETLQVRRIDQIIKWACQIAANEVEGTLPHKASKLRQASAHWLRHSYVTYLLNNGAPLKVAQENAGHSDISTTMHYRHVSQVDRHQATRYLSMEENTNHNVSISLAPSQAIEKSIILGDDDETGKQITLNMHFYVENNSKFVRGKTRSFNEIKETVFSRYDIKVIDEECAKYEITLSYTTYKNLDEQVEEIEMEASSIADYRNGFIEFDVYTFDGEKSWPFAGWD